MQSQNEIKQICGHASFPARILPVILFCSLLNSFSGVGAGAAQSLPFWNLVGSLNAGRYLHSATLLQNGMVLVAGGIGRDSTGAETSLDSAELYDPATGVWSRTASMSTPRIYHTATLLPNGKVLVAGGASRIDASGNQATPLDTAEIYDPATGGWTPAGNFRTARGAHTATLLRDGRVLIAGGALVNVDSTASVEIYDAAAGAWSAGSNLNTARSVHAAVLLSGGQVLVAGGFSNGQVLASVEIYDPASGQWTPAAPLVTPRFLFSVTVLPDGQVLAAGGGADPDFDLYRGAALNSAELYNPATGVWTAAGNLNLRRGQHSATLLPNGQVLVSGGLTGQNNVTVGAETYDPATRTWSIGARFYDARFLHTVTLLPSGQALAVGGIASLPLVNNKFVPTVNNSAETFGPVATGVWSQADSLKAPRRATLNALSPDHSATLLPDGKVLVAGGSLPPAPLNAVELYDPSSRTWGAAQSLTLARREHTATLLSNGKVLLTGGSDGRGLATNTAEVYDPSAGGSRTANDLSIPSRLHTATLLADGLVLIAGGEAENALTRTFGARVFERSIPTAVVLGRAELYDPTANRWRVTGSLARPRSAHTAVLLPNGKVLVAGGSDGRNLATATAELFDPATGTWSATGSLNTARRLHTATLLPSGKVLVAGGEIAANTPTETVEIYDPATGAWTKAFRLRYVRYSHTATLLPNGQVLVTGGHDGSGAIRESETYDPAADSWTRSGDSNPPRSLHTATLLLNGQTLIVGGAGAPNSAELFDAVPGIARKPVLSSVPASLIIGGKLSVTGSGFAGGPEASSGNAQSSASNYPLLQLRSLANDQSRFLLADPAGNWSDTSFTSQAVTGFPRGQALVSIVSNGVSSDARILLIGCAAITLSPSALPAATACTAYSQTFTAAGGTGPYTFSTAQNRLPPGLRLAGDTLLGTPTQPGIFTVPIVATDANGCASLMDFPLTVNPSAGSVKTTPAATSFAETDPQRRPNPSPSSQCIAIENTGCSLLQLRLDSIVRMGGERINDANDWRSLSDPTDRRPFSAKWVLSGGTEIPLTPGRQIDIRSGETARVCLLFDPLIPRRAFGAATLSTQQVLPEQIASQVRFVETPTVVIPFGQPPLQFNFAVGASLNPLVRLIHQSDSALPPQVTLARAGDEFTVNLAVYDPNMDLYLIRYQFLDSGGNQVEPNIDVDMAEAIGRSGLARGQSFGISQRFEGASQRSDVAGVRVIVFDRTGEESAISVPAGSSSFAANARQAGVQAQGFTLELPARRLAPRAAIVRKPQPATRGRRR